MEESKKPSRFTKVRHAGKAIRKKTLGYIAGALGLVAGLAWNDAFKFLIENLIPDIGNTIVAKLIYAIAITLIISLVIYYIEKSLEEPAPK